MDHKEQNLIEKFFDPDSFVRQPWVLIVALELFGIIVYLLVHHDLSVEKAAFFGAMTVSGLFVGKASVSMASDAPLTATLLAALGGTIFLLTLNFTSAETFKDVVVEGLLLQFVGGFSVLLDETIKRSNRRRGIVLPKEESNG